MPKVRELVCPLRADAGSPSLRVTFLRFDEALAGNLVLGEKVPEIEKLFGDAKLVDNEVSKELKALFQQFAKEDVLPGDGIAFTVTTLVPNSSGSADRESADLPRAASGENLHLWSFAGTPQLESSSQQQIAIPGVADTLYRRRTWPDKFSQFYNCPNRPAPDPDSPAAESQFKIGAIACTRNWRYLTQLRELDAIERETDRAYRKLNADQPDARGAHKDHFALLRHLGRKAWPSDFLVITADLEYGCETSYFDGYYAMPPIGLDVAMIENASDQVVRIRDLTGVIENDTGLRAAPAPDSLKSRVSRLNRGELVIQPHGRLIIPLQAFAIGGVIDADRWGTLEEANKIYQQIMALSARTFDYTVQLGSRGSVLLHVKKDKTAFKPPAIPRKAEFLLGSQLFLSGFVVENETLDVAMREPNVIELFAPEQEDAVPRPSDVKLNVHEKINVLISCPILYSWDGKHSEWVKHGKVIHTANGPEKETTSVVDVATDVRQIRLSEEEPEVSFIRAVQLILTLRDGRRVEIDPVGMRKGRLAPWMRIPAFHRSDFRFDVPAEYESIGIERAQIAVTGYYQRLGSFLLSRAGRPLGRTN